MPTMKPNQKLIKILAFSNWTQDRLADLMEVSNMTVSKWARGKRKPKGKHAEMLNTLYAELVEPYVCELEEKADEIAKRLLRQQIQALLEDNICKK